MLIGSRKILSGMVVVLAFAAHASAQAPVDEGPEVGEGVTNKVTLQVQLSGLGKQGCIVEIRPAHPGCKFKPRKYSVPGLSVDRAVALEPIVIDAESIGADRDCSFAITVREPGQTPRTFQRGLQLIEPTAAVPVPEKTLKCYLSASSVARRGGGTPPTRRR